MLAGQQCCYDKKGNLIDRDYKGALPDDKSPDECMGSIDLVGGAAGEQVGIPRWWSRGCCRWDDGGRVQRHWDTDVEDSNNCDKYKEVQNCMREEGIPSGDQSGDPRGASEAAFHRAYEYCMSKFGCKATLP